jgi:hypothetical protein
MNIRDVTPGASDRRDALRRSLLKIAAKVLGVAVLDFLLLRVWAPNLVNQHQDLALAAGIACFALAIAATAWLAYRLWVDIGRLNHARRRGALPNIRTIED